VYPQPQEHSFFVADGPLWNVPLVDVHAFTNGSDVWFIGVSNPIHRGNYSEKGYAMDLLLFGTPTPTSPPRMFTAPGPGLHGTYYSLSIVPFFSPFIVSYFCGFFLGNDDTLVFGLTRGFFDINNINFNITAPVMNYNATLDTVALYPAEFVTYNADFKPFIYHTFWNFSWMQNNTVNATWTYVIDPFWNTITQVEGSLNYGTGLRVTGLNFVYQPNWPWSGANIVSSALYYPKGFLFVGLAVPGTGTGAINVHVDLTNLGFQVIVPLPTNMSDPRAMVLDEFEGVLYVALNGGGAVLRYNISDKGTPLVLTGMQNLPFYLHRAWTGLATPEHLYFATNEQVAKVFRLNKHDFCPAQCMQFGYCEKGQCICSYPFRKVGNQCDWQEVIRDRETIKKDHGGEVALGILFMITTILAGVFGFLWYRNRRHSYTAV
jgi:hypothetical protein